MEVEMPSGSRKRDRQKSFQEFDSDDDQSEAGTVDSRELGNQRGSGKGIRQNHSEIEKRRRDKMNTHIHELSTMIPMCTVMSRKLDKLTVLRMAVQHMRALKGEASSSESNCKPSFLSDEDFKNLILESADGFLFVVACDRGRILYVSDSVQNVLSQSQSDLVGQSFFDLVHPKDVNVVKDQLSCFDTVPREKNAERTTSPPKQENKQTNKPMCTGARRSFLCRMKIGSKMTKRGKGMDEGSTDFCIMNRKSKTKAIATTDKKKHAVVHFTGYLKSWPPSGYSFDDEDEDQDSRNLSCLVAVGRQVKVADENTDPTSQEFPNEFVSRHSTDGKFIHVDQRITAMCGYLPNELQGESGYDYFHPDDLDIVANSHKSTLLGKTNTTPPYRFLCKAGHYIYLRTESTVFRNPWTKELEFIICVNTRYDHTKNQPIQPILCVQSNPQQRLILPAPSSKTVSSGARADGTSGRRMSVRELMATIQTQPPEEGKPNMKPRPMMPQTTSDEDDPNADPAASKIGVLIAETVQWQETANKRQHTSIIGNNTHPNTSLNSRSESSFRASDSSGSIMDFSHMTTPMNVDTPNPQIGNMTSSFSGVTAPGLPEISQPNLLEQLIGMQQAIESMESPMQQSEESMAVFMNMLEADAGLGGDLSDFLFQENS